MEQSQLIEKESRVLLEEMAFRQIAKNMLCLAYANRAKSEMNRLFICVGCEENQGNQSQKRDAIG